MDILIGFLFLFVVSFMFSPIAIYLFIKICQKYVDNSLNGLKLYRRQNVAVYTDKHGNEIMINRNEKIYKST